MHAIKKLVVLFIFVLAYLNCLGSQTSSANFHIEPLSKDVRNELTAVKIWFPGCPVNFDELRILSVSYYDLAGKSHQDGKIILHQSAANAALSLFKRLYALGFPFSSINTLIPLKGDWQKAQNSNVTYGFICQLSDNHLFTPQSYGKTLTINPALNPEILLSNIPNQTVDKEKRTQQFASSIKLQPNTGLFSINRNLHLKGMTEAVESEFNKQGFIRSNLSSDRISWSQFVFTGTKKPANQNFGKNTYFITPLEKQATNTTFKYEALSQTIKDQLIKSNYWHTGCPVDLDRLNIVTFSYYDFNGATKLGQVAVFDAMAPYLSDAFKELYAKKFPIEIPAIITPPDTITTTAFKCRAITSGRDYSLHSYALAIDINVSRNPYIGAFSNKEQDQLIGLLGPYSATSLSYLNRSQIHPGMNEAIVEIMKQHGFIEWGGDWQDRADFMHFQVPKNIALNLAHLDSNSAKQLIALLIQHPQAAKRMSNDQRWQYLYKLFPTRYMQRLQKYFPLLQTEEETKVLSQLYLDLLTNSGH